MICVSFARACYFTHPFWKPKFPRCCYWKERTSSLLVFNFLQSFVLSLLVISLSNILLYAAHHFLPSFSPLCLCTMFFNVFSQWAFNSFSFFPLSTSSFPLKYTFCSSKSSHFSFLCLVNHSLLFNKTTVGIPSAAWKLPHSSWLLHKNELATADACSLSWSSSHQSQKEHFHWFLKGARLLPFFYFKF